MSDAAHNPGRPPAADEKPKEMRRAQDADLPFGKTLLQPCESVQGANPTGGELQEDDGQEKRRKG